MILLRGRTIVAMLVIVIIETRITKINGHCSIAFYTVLRNYPVSSCVGLFSISWISHKDDMITVIIIGDDVTTPNNKHIWHEVNHIIIIWLTSPNATSV